MKFFTREQDDRTAASPTALAEAEAAFTKLHAENLQIEARIAQLQSRGPADQWLLSETREERAQVGDRLRAAEIRLTNCRIAELRDQLPAAVAAVEPKRQASDAAWSQRRAAADESDRLASEYHFALSKVSGIESNIACFERRIAELQAVADRTDAIETDGFAERLARLEKASTKLISAA